MASPASANVVSPGAPYHFGLVYFDDHSPNIAFVYLDVSPYNWGVAGCRVTAVTALGSYNTYRA